MSSLKEIKAPIKQEMVAFEKKFKAAMRSDVKLLNAITHYIVKRKGKQMRPMFVFLTAKLNGGITEATYRGCILVELLHTATLVHDDVVDDSNLRRGYFSVNALWKNKIAVLVGDYLLSRGLLVATTAGDLKMLSIVSNAVKMMSEGELMQIQKARRLDITEEIYFEVIRKKTASLIASCCAIGAASNGAKDSEIEKFRLFGEKIGLAFQIKDDLLDFSNSNKIGKPTGIDIKEQKMTLPLIYALNNAAKSTRKDIISTVKHNNNNPKKVKEVIEFIEKSGGGEYAQQKMLSIKNEALESLQDVEKNTFKKTLIQLVDFVVDRQY